MKKYLSRSASNCVHNHKVRFHGNGTIGVCKNDLKTSLLDSGIFVCDTQETCNECELYECGNTEASISSKFTEILKDPSLCGQEYPKTAMLLWVLNGNIPRKETLFQRIKNAFS